MKPSKTNILQLCSVLLSDAEALSNKSVNMPTKTLTTTTFWNISDKT